jgi:uncharacterized membrane protein YeaQ/YmgE (transglycosylase-associated protein family)
MPPQAYALVTLFALSSVLLGWLAARIATRVGGPRSLAAYVLPIVAAFLAFYVIGHRLGLAVGPELTLFGFRVALIGDLAIGFAAALLVAVAQAGVLRITRPAREA